MEASLPPSHRLTGGLHIVRYGGHDNWRTSVVTLAEQRPASFEHRQVYLRGKTFERLLKAINKTERLLKSDKAANPMLRSIWEDRLRRQSAELDRLLLCF